MLSSEDLHRTLQRIDRRSYRAYRDIEGAFRFDDFDLFVDHVQSDPFAPPSWLRIRMPMSRAGYPEDMLVSRGRRVSLGDFLVRSFFSGIRRANARPLSIDAGGQAVLERTAATVSQDAVELRFTARLPAAGRTILGREAERLLMEILPGIVREVVPFASLDAGLVWRHIRTIEDAQALREQLDQRALIAFVANGAILPRASGASDLPLRSGVIAFQSPPELAVELATPHSGDVLGMGVPAGTTLIVGGGYHGKSTLLQALQTGVYDHIPDDGREKVVSVIGSVKIRSEDGRSVKGVDISPFLSDLPSGTETAQFSTDDASGSTSMAAGIMEALEVGARVLLLDEDTSATNFLLRDELMRRLVPKHLEPITPLIDRLPELKELEISTIHVIGGHGEYFGVADRVILMESYRPRDVTLPAHRIAASVETESRSDSEDAFRMPTPRIPLPDSVSAATRRGSTKIRARDLDEIRFGSEEIDLSTVEQIIDQSQTRAIGNALLHMVATGLIDGRRTLAEGLELLSLEIAEEGLEAITRQRFRSAPGDLALPRTIEVAAALNRLRTLRVRQLSGS